MSVAPHGGLQNKELKFTDIIRARVWAKIKYEKIKYEVLKIFYSVNRTINIFSNVCKTRNEFYSLFKEWNARLNVFNFTD